MTGRDRGVALGCVRGVRGGELRRVDRRARRRERRPRPRARDRRTEASGSTSQKRVGIGVPSWVNGALRTTTGAPSGPRTTTVEVGEPGSRPRSSRDCDDVGVRRGVQPCAGSLRAGRALLLAGRCGRRRGGRRTVVVGTGTTTYGVSPGRTSPYCSRAMRSTSGVASSFFASFSSRLRLGIAAAEPLLGRVDLRYAAGRRCASGTRTRTGTRRAPARPGTADSATSPPARRTRGRRRPPCSPAGCPPASARDARRLRRRRLRRAALRGRDAFAADALRRGRPARWLRAPGRAACGPPAARRLSHRPLRLAPARAAPPR